MGEEGECIGKVIVSSVNFPFGVWINELLHIALVNMTNYFHFQGGEVSCYKRLN